MNLIEGHNSKWDFFREITGKAMMVHRKYHPVLLESAYETALKYLLEKDGYIVERQKYLPIFWDDVQLEQSYRMDLVICLTECSLTSVQKACSLNGIIETRIQKRLKRSG